MDNKFYLEISEGIVSKEVDTKLHSFENLQAIKNIN